MRYDPIIPVEQSHEPPGSPNNGRYNGNGEDDLLIEERLSGRYAEHQKQHGNMPELSPSPVQHKHRVVYNSNEIPSDPMAPNIVFDDSALRKYAS